MTDGTSQGLFIVVAIVIFGIFVSLSYTVFGDMGDGIIGLFETSIQHSEKSLERPVNFEHTYEMRSSSTLEKLEGEYYKNNSVYTFTSEGLTGTFSIGDLVTWFHRDAEDTLIELEGNRMEVIFYAKSDTETTFWLRAGGALMHTDVRYSGETLYGDSEWRKYVYEFTVPEYETSLTESRAAFVMAIDEPTELLITKPQVVIYK